MENTTILAGLAANPLLLAVVVAVAFGMVILAVVLYRDSQTSQRRRKQAVMADFKAVHMPKLLERLGISPQAYVRQSDAAVLARQVRRCARCRIGKECEGRLLRGESILPVIKQCPNRSGIEANRATIDFARSQQVLVS